MNLSETQDKLKVLSENKNYSDFIFGLLEVYSFPKTTILKLRKEENKSVLKLKNKFFFKETTIEEDEHVAIDSLSKDKDVLKLNPRFIIVTDYENFVAIDTRKSIEDSSRTLDIKIVDLYKRYDFFAPWIGIESYQVDKETVADIRAASRMAKLYDQIIADNPNFYTDDSKDLNLFLSRLLFCFFAEDTGIFEKNLFTNSILSNSNADADNLSQYISTAFDVFNIDYSKRDDKYRDFNNFPYVNGGLFKDKITIPKFTKKTRDLLEECGNLDWSEINPDIFGSMIQAVVHPDDRENLGMHYTSVPNIMKLIRPLFLDELYEEYFRVLNNKKKLEDLRQRISKIKIFDPACGSGNFLIISYKELCKLEALILKQLIGEGTRLDLDITFSSLSLNNFYGIEIDDFAHDVAKLSLYLAQHQVNVMFEKQFGKLKPILPLRESGNIVCGNSARLDWEKVCSNEGEIYIVGNPPYLGARMQDPSQKSDMELNMSKINSFKNLDYIAIWFIKGSEYIAKNQQVKLAFVSTNSICQGEQVALLWPRIFSNDIEICFAYQSFKWENNAKNNAGVTVIIVGLSKKDLVKNKQIFIDSKAIKASNINGYLVNSSNIFLKSRSNPLSSLPDMNFGSMPNDGGNLMLEKNEYYDLMKTVPGIKKFVKKIIGAEEFINGTKKYCIWVENKDLQEADRIPFLRNRFDKVSKFRIQSSREATKKLALYSYRFAENRHKNKNSIVVPGISSEKRAYIPIGFLSKEYVINNRCYIIYTDEIYLFGILTSLMHMIWVRAVAGKLETRLSYSKDIVYNNFPFPKITDTQKEIITKQVYNILDEREKHPGKTLADLYDPEKMPYGLKQAHEFLDEVIDRIYKTKPFEDDEERLAHLFKLYEEMTEKEKRETEKGVENKKLLKEKLKLDKVSKKKITKKKE